MLIHSIETFGTHEGPGIRFVIFVQGCNFKCLYCHNVDTQKVKSKVKSQKLKAVEFSTDKLAEMIENNRSYFGEKGGVTVSGGEPLLQAKKVMELFKRLKNNVILDSPACRTGEIRDLKIPGQARNDNYMGINTALDTNGSILTNDVRELLKYTDLVLLDIKHINIASHQKITGYEISNSKFLISNQIPKPNSINTKTNVISTHSEPTAGWIEQGEKSYGPGVPSITFANYLESINKPFWVRYVLVPGLTDNEYDLIKLGQSLKNFKNLKRIEILPYHTLGVHKYKELGIDYKLADTEPPTKEKIEKAKETIGKYSGKPVYIR